MTDLPNLKLLLNSVVYQEDLAVKNVYYLKNNVINKEKPFLIGPKNPYFLYVICVYPEEALTFFRKYKDELDINLSNHAGWTPLMVTSAFSRINTNKGNKIYQTLAQELIQAGADVNKKMVDHNTALHLTIFNHRVNSWTMVQTLLQAGIDVNHQNKHGETALMLAVRTDVSVKTMQLLIDHQADLNITNKIDQTALMIACELKKLPVVKVLVANGADVNINPKDGNTTALTYAGNEMNDLNKYLLGVGAQPAPAQFNLLYQYVSHLHQKQNHWLRVWLQDYLYFSHDLPTFIIEKIYRYTQAESS